MVNAWCKKKRLLWEVRVGRALNTPYLLVLARSLHEYVRGKQVEFVGDAHGQGKADGGTKDHPAGHCQHVDEV